MGAQTLYLIACAAFLLLSLPGEIGRLDLREANLLLAFLVIQMIGVTYLSSATASLELAMEGEKGLPDLVLSAFAPRSIAWGKALSAWAYATYLVVVALPLVVLAAAVRGAPIAAVAAAGALTAVVASAAGIWGAWLSGRFASDFTRSLVHWTLLAGLLGGTVLLPAAWWAVSPLRLLDRAVRGAWSPWLLGATVGYWMVGVVGVLLIERHVRHARAEGDA